MSSDCGVGGGSLIGRGLPRERAAVEAEAWMRRALDVAAQTPAGDIPVGAVVFGPDGRELGCGTNRREADADPAGHAEVAAIRAAARELGDAWRLEECTLVVTLEPCAMCAGLALGARVGRIIYGACEPKTGACGSVWDLPREAPLHKAEVLGGVLREDCVALLKDFFSTLRT
ncbi:nucleoside deaminase [Corynebacterium urogenitale]|uniref:nucleoside deaminase n=1 Tax=Corynebacterium urogenitale TaxID=2487892 RepID=UPI001F44E56E|nr:nucleoside deaminase [Corynebacterium urogenitale]